MIKIRHDQLGLTKPTKLRYEPEWENGRLYCLVIETSVSRTRWEPKPGEPGSFSPAGIEEAPLTLAFERAYGLLLWASDQQLVLGAAQKLGLTAAGGGPLGWRLPDAWLDSDPWRWRPLGGPDPAETGASWEVAEVASASDVGA
jgi:hypothetical protein